MRVRTLAAVIAEEAPVSPRRALALAAGVTRSLSALDAATAPSVVTADEIELHEDGTIRYVAEPDRPPSGDEDPELGAAVGRFLHALLTGREPLGREDAHEPALVAALPSSTCALIARSASEAPGQWPSLAEWSVELAAVAGAVAPPPPESEIRRRRRRRTVLTAALVALVALSAIVVWLAPGWWDDATDEGSIAPSGQLVRASS